MLEAKAQTPPIMPKYAPLSRMANRSDMQMLTKTIRPPPPMPWMTRAAMSMFIFTDTAASREPTKKMALVTSRMGFLPKISDTLPHIGVAAEFAIK